FNNAFKKATPFGGFPDSSPDAQIDIKSQSATVKATQTQPQPPTDQPGKRLSRSSYTKRAWLGAAAVAPVSFFTADFFQAAVERSSWIPDKDYIDFLSNTIPQLAGAKTGELLGAALAMLAVLAIACTIYYTCKAVKTPTQVAPGK